ncbi:sporulation phosphorelay system protein KapB [Paenibacillus sp. y28]|uniref:sporulation phosphorelay system protein KapB n=1 Tax=Paenibacillus sp. y28 TaxID=3129110 RepID=UPI00301ABFB8
MNSVDLQPGMLVTASYKTGEYVAELLEVSSPRALVQILAVVKHPTQGDLHQPMQAEVAFFHQRRALAFREKCNVLLSDIRPYRSAAVPDYQASLRQALEKELQGLRQTAAWIERSVSELEALQREYFRA